MKILVTGCAGFIGMHACLRLLRDGHEVLGVDNLDAYYDVNLKRARLKLIKAFEKFTFIKLDIVNRKKIESLFEQFDIQRVIHLAAQPGVRYSTRDPYSYIRNNIDGFLNVLEGCRHHNVDHLVYAGSSSIYGINSSLPFSEKQNTDHPVSLYGATKKANELMAHAYSHLYGLPTTGLRFFTAYGPWGRPDMSPHLFTEAILEGVPIELFNNGKMRRDFTYIDDVVEGIVRIMNIPATPDFDYNFKQPDPSCSSAPYRIYNIGNHQPVKLLTYIKILEKALNKKAKINMLPRQLTELPETFADVNDLAAAAGFAPSTSLREGIAKFVKWYLEYYGYKKYKQPEK
ncbi:MAG: NAD-dependent epimerase [Syntrophaceae bacterium]|nr:NAD-dependent epimerase [Syntrophaceae bacterium]